MPSDATAARRAVDRPAEAMKPFRSLILLVVVVSAALPVDAQEKVLIYGHIRDLVDDRPITDATILVERSGGIQRTMVVDEEADYGY